MRAPRGDTDVRARITLRCGRVVYWVLLVVLVALLIHLREHRLHPVQLGALVALSVVEQGSLHRLRSRITRLFDLSIGLSLVAVALGGPLAGFVVIAAPDVIFLARRRQAPWRLWAIANWVSYAALALAGDLVLKAVTLTHGPLDGLRLMAAGVAMLLANYVFARLLLEIVRHRANPLRLLRDELVRGLPVESVAIAVGTIAALLVPGVGVLALAVFVAIIYSPQLVVLQLLRAPSVAGLSVDAAAATYRDALADELHLSRADRRYTHAIDALAQHRPLPSLPANPLAFAKDALLVTICTERPPVQRAFTASLRVQVVLVARRWAQLTARCTPALSHHEAMTELRASSLAQDAPLGIDAAARIVEREHALTEHVAAVPRLHRAPLPRALRRGLLPLALSRLSA